MGSVTAPITAAADSKLRNRAKSADMDESTMDERLARRHADAAKRQHSGGAALTWIEG
jgi:hypothetical protein